MVSFRAARCVRGRLSGAFAAAACLVTVPAWAQRLDLGMEGDALPSVRGGKASKGSERIVMDTGHLGIAGEMAFFTSERSPWTPRFELTDVALLRLDVRRSFANWLELSAGGELLVKQPTTTRAPVGQGVHLGALAEFAPGFGASLGAAMGPLVGADGLYYRGGPGLAWKPVAGQYLRFVVGAGNAWTFLDFERDTERTFSIGEAVAAGETQIGDDRASMWVGIGYAFPFAKNPDADAADPVRGFLDPQPRVSFEVGGALNVGAKDWNVYAAYSIVDRGERSRPETTLPILDGGFDQQQLVVGVEYRFTPKRDGGNDDGWE